ncbi:hypothetical protein GOODEAATRI_027291, partial [Goodea atripinnis]
MKTHCFLLLLQCHSEKYTPGGLPESRGTMGEKSDSENHVKQKLLKHMNKETTSKNQRACLGPMMESLNFDSPDAENSIILLKLFVSNVLFINLPLPLCILH